jgi:putative NIF3 family GTP cyclohydrolase 1 type 2
VIWHVLVSVLAERLAQATAEPFVRVLAVGPEKTSRVECISGGAASLMGQVVDAGFDTFVTG